MLNPHPETIAAAMRLAADARQHAGQEVEIAIKRKAFDRSLAAMQVGPLGLS